MTPVQWGVAFGWHLHPWEDLRALVQRAEALGYAAVFVDGDISMLDSESRRDVLHGWTATTALLAATSRIGVGSMRLAHHWNTAQLAQAVATAERLWPGRLRFVIGLGDRPHDERFGLPALPAPERFGMLSEVLPALRALWRGDPVTVSGRHVNLNEARVSPPPGDAFPIAVAAARPRMLGLVAAHADVWDVNLPALPARVAAASERLARACDAAGRDPAGIQRSQWVFTRPGTPAEAVAAFRRFCPWFGDLSDREIEACVAAGSPERCRERSAELAAELSLDLPVLDLSGLPAGPAAALLEACAPEKSCVDAGIPSP